MPQKKSCNSTCALSGHSPLEANSLENEGLGIITNAVYIRERQACVEGCAVVDHWESDLIAGSNNSCIATLVEWCTRYVMLVRLKSKDTETMISALIKQAHKLLTELYKALTWDRGSEMADHQRFILATDIKVYFCDPKSPWQRGLNESTKSIAATIFS